MSYEERIKKLFRKNKPFWYTQIDTFIKTTYDNKEQGVNDLENLAKDSVKFNEFTKQIISKKENLKKIKENWFANIPTEKYVNAEKVSEKLVLDIKNLKDNEKASISALLNKKIDSKTMFSIYNLVIKKLKAVGLYLNFGIYENQRVGLPFNIPFKKGYIQNIGISTRTYNGKYKKGSILKKSVEFKLEGGNASIRTCIKFCIDTKNKDKATLECYIPFNMNEENIIELDNLINEIKREYQPCCFKRQQVFIQSEYLKFIDLKINGVDYVISSDDKVVSKLRVLINCDLANQALDKSYKFLVDD